MRKGLIGFFIGGVLGFAAGAGAMLIVFPFLFPPAAVNETVTSVGDEAIIATTDFRQGVVGQDSAHWGRGELQVYRDKDGGVLLALQDDFEVGPGPNLWVYLNTTADVNEEDAFNADNDRIKVAKVKSFTGAQIYRVSASDYRKAKSVTIWCDSFGQYIASANLPEVTDSEEKESL